MSESDDPFDDPEWLEYARHARETLAPMIEDSAIGVSIYNGEVDPKMAIETGYLILLDKPIIVAVSRNAKVPNKLALVADEIVEVDLDNPEACQASLAAAIERITSKGGGQLDP